MCIRDSNITCSLPITRAMTAQWGKESHWMHLIDLERDTNFTLQNQLTVKGQSLGFVSLPRRHFWGARFSSLPCGERMKNELPWKRLRGRLTKPKLWPFMANWFWSVKFVSISKSIKRIQWDSFPHWAVIALVIGKLWVIFIASKRKPKY